MLGYITKLTRNVSSLRSGYSRIPVHMPGRPLAFQGLLLLKKVCLFTCHLAVFVIDTLNL